LYSLNTIIVFILDGFDEKIYYIAIIIHNHLIEDKASDDDRRQLKDLKKHGFKGPFLIYCKRTNKTYHVQD